MALYDNEHIIRSDALLLGSLWMCRGLEGDAWLRGLIATIDYLDHAIVSRDDLNEGLFRLQAAGAVMAGDGCMRLAPEWMVSDDYFGRRVRVSRLMEYYEGRLRRLKREDDVVEPHQQTFAELDCKGFEKALQEYLDSHRSKRL